MSGPTDEEFLAATGITKQEFEKELAKLGIKKGIRIIDGKPTEVYIGIRLKTPEERKHNKQ